MAVNKERVQLLVDALRSGEFEQCEGFLRLENKFCCLGVACEVAIRNGLRVDITVKPVSQPNSVKAAYCYDGNQGNLPPSVQYWYGFDDTDPLVGQGEATDNGCQCSACMGRALTATGANDRVGWDFNQIADGFEKTYLTEHADG